MFDLIDLQTPNISFMLPSAVVISCFAIINIFSGFISQISVKFFVDFGIKHLSFHVVSQILMNQLQLYICLCSVFPFNIKVFCCKVFYIASICKFILNRLLCPYQIGFRCFDFSTSASFDSTSLSLLILIVCPIFNTSCINRQIK